MRNAVCLVGKGTGSEVEGKKAELMKVMIYKSNGKGFYCCSETMKLQNCIK
jgi:hypothetical protein